MAPLTATSGRLTISTVSSPLRAGIRGDGGSGGLSACQPSPSGAPILYAAAPRRKNPFYPWFKTVGGVPCRRDITSTRVGFLSIPEPGALHLRHDRAPREGFGGSHSSAAEMVTSWLKARLEQPFVLGHTYCGSGVNSPCWPSPASGTGFRGTRTGLCRSAARNYLAPGVILPYSAASGCYWNAAPSAPKSGREPLPAVPNGEVLDDLRSLTATTQPVLPPYPGQRRKTRRCSGHGGCPPQVPGKASRGARNWRTRNSAGRSRRSGCVMLKLGLESGDQEVLDRMGKGHPPPDRRNGAGEPAQAGIACTLPPLRHPAEGLKWRRAGP